MGQINYSLEKQTNINITISPKIFANNTIYSFSSNSSSIPNFNSKSKSNINDGISQLERWGSSLRTLPKFNFSKYLEYMKLLSKENQQEYSLLIDTHMKLWGQILGYSPNTTNMVEYVIDMFSTFESKVKSNTREVLDRFKNILVYNKMGGFPNQSSYLGRNTFIDYKSIAKSISSLLGRLDQFIEVIRNPFLFSVFGFLPLYLECIGGDNPSTGGVSNTQYQCLLVVQYIESTFFELMGEKLSPNTCPVDKRNQSNSKLQLFLNEWKLGDRNVYPFLAHFLGCIIKHSDKNPNNKLIHAPLFEFLKNLLKLSWYSLRIPFTF